MKRKALVVTVGLVGLGCLQMTADVLGMPRLKGLAMATQMSPAMKVFTAYDGYEAYAQQFFVDWYDAEGARHVVEITPERYSRVSGPYNRRNVYGAAFAAGPILRADARTREAHDSMMRYALCSPGILRHELEVPDDAQRLVARVVPLGEPPRQALDLSWEVTCER
jgi:hypothetical protein